MPLKDHYRILEIPSNASIDEVKKAFRKLAHQFHPDKTEGNEYATARFTEAQEAYTILSDERLRRLYDEERFFAGMAAQKEPRLLTAEWLAQQSAKLSVHMAQVDSDRMNHDALSSYLHLLLSDAHIAALLAETDQSHSKQVVDNIIVSIRRLRYPLVTTLLERLIVLTAQDAERLQRIRNIAAKRRQEHTLEKMLPWVVVGISIVICIVMFLFGRRPNL